MSFQVLNRAQVIAFYEQGLIGFVVANAAIFALENNRIYYINI